ncbi:MAG: hypothetical protein RBR08_15500 [Desulforegulaceae bacterium]|nr:hypothetical protein [Desulforegulaceae bacterium]
MKLYINFKKNKFLPKIKEIISNFFLLLKDKYFYIAVSVLIGGIQLNFFCQNYLLDYTKNGSSLPVLSDLILDNIPLWDIDYIYDIFSLVSLFAIIFYMIHRKKYDKIPYLILLSGIFQIVRGFFIVLTPFGNPPGFDGTEGLFNGFSKIELGVYPSGHTGISFLYFLFAEDSLYKFILLSSVIIIIIALFLSRGHYTIDILSGIFFAYAIKAYGDKHFLDKMTQAYSKNNKNKLIKIDFSGLKEFKKSS